LNEFFEGARDILFEHACKLCCGGIVSKRLGSPFRSGRSPQGQKSKRTGGGADQKEAALPGLNKKSSSSNCYSDR
jgi:ATP-dependent DNA ligase